MCCMHPNLRMKPQSVSCKLSLCHQQELDWSWITLSNIQRLLALPLFPERPCCPLRAQDFTARYRKMPNICIFHCTTLTTTSAPIANITHLPHKIQSIPTTLLLSISFLPHILICVATAFKSAFPRSQQHSPGAQEDWGFIHRIWIPQSHCPAGFICRVMSL